MFSAFEGITSSRKAGEALSEMRFIATPEADGSVKYPTASMTHVFGVSKSTNKYGGDCAIGDEVSIIHNGIVRIIAEEAITNRALVTAGTAGKAKVKGAGDVAFGITMEASTTAGDMILIKLI